MTRLMEASRSSGTLVNLATLILMVAALYFGKPILMPVAAATLFAFLLAPLVNAMVRKGIRPPIAVIAVVISMGTLFTGILFGFGTQLRSLAYGLPNYRQNLREKVADLRGAGKGPALDRFRQTWHEIRGELQKPTPQTNEATSPTSTTNAPNSEPDPLPVVVKKHDSTDLASMPTALGPLLEVLATGGLIVVLVIFMLLRKRELRNRVILLFGY